MQNALKKHVSERCLFTAAALFIFTIDFDSSTVMTSLPVAALELSAAATEPVRAIYDYSITTASCLLISDRHTDLLGGRTWLFVSAAVFSLASLIDDVAGWKKA